MTAPYRKKLIEVALPLEAINVASAREKSIRHGHPSTLHLWWARRPLAACRAVLFASLVDDPDSDPAYAHYDAETREHMAGEKRQQLFDLITELVQWENSNNELVINAARAEIARCVASRKIETGELKKDHKLPGGETVYDLLVKGHGDLKKLRENLVRLPKAESVNAFLAEYAPPVLDPFCGGGSIPVEAQRLGLRAYASDLNPVPVLITKALIEIPPKFANQPPVNPEARRQGKINETWKDAQGLADDVRYYGKWIRDEAEKRIGHLYPKVNVTADMAKDRPDLKPYVGQALIVVTWLWARTVRCTNPACRLDAPLVKSFMLSTKQGNKVWLNPRASEDGGICFEIKRGTGEVPEGTVSRAGGRCLRCGTHLPFDMIRSEGKLQHLGSKLLCVVVQGSRERLFLPATRMHEEIAEHVEPTWVPDVEMAHNPFSLRPPLYGMSKFSDLFTGRQLITLMTLCDLVAVVQPRIAKDASTSGLTESGQALEAGGEGVKAYAEAVAVYLALGVSRTANTLCTIARWTSSRCQTVTAFARQALPMTWDYPEVNPFSGAAGDFGTSLDSICESLDALIADPPGTVRQQDAASAPLAPGERLVSTDPPYYNNIDYADLSDFFYVWLRRMLSSIFPRLVPTVLVPKSDELVASPYRFEGSRERARQHFLSGLEQAFRNMRAINSRELPLTVYYAFKQAEDSTEDEGDGTGDSIAAIASTGWETMLEGLIASGFGITGTWPMRTELANRPMANTMNSLASSILISCRPRLEDAPLTTRREFLATLKRELPESLLHLQRGNIAPVDLAQAAIGPGMAVFSRYVKVVEADGSSMKVRQALALINQTLDEVLAEQEGEFDADTRWALAWFDQFGMDEGAFGVAETLSKAKNTAVNGLEQAGILRARGGKVRLLKRDELPPDWNPATDTRLRHWEVVQHLIRALETGGETAAADLLRKLGGDMGEIGRDLAYRLYNICERKGWAGEALAYNGLVISWPEISKLAQQAAPSASAEQARMF